MIRAFQLARPRNKGEWAVVADRQISDLHVSHIFYADTCSRRMDAVIDINR